MKYPSPMTHKGLVENKDKPKRKREPPHGSDNSEAFPSYMAHVQTCGFTGAMDNPYSRRCLIKMKVMQKHVRRRQPMQHVLHSIKIYNMRHGPIWAS